MAHSGPVDREQELWVAVLATNALLAGATALGQYGLERYRGLGIHVLIAARRRVLAAPPGVLVHRTSVLARSDVHVAAAPPSTSPARSVVDAAQWAASDDDACAIVAAAFQRRLVLLAEIEAVLDRLTQARRRALIRTAARDAALGAHSLAELDFLWLNRRYRLPEPVLQLRRRDANGRARYLDAYYAGYGVHVEIDGGQHNDPGTHWADMQRQNDLWIPGDRVLRFPSWLPRARPDELFTQLRTALESAGWRP